MEDLKKRAGAAAKLQDMELIGLARYLEVSYPTLGRWLEKDRWRRHEREALIRNLADYFELPYEFFTLDLETLVARLQIPSPDEQARDDEDEIPPAEMPA